MKIVYFLFYNNVKHIKQLNVKKERNISYFDQKIIT